MDHQQQELVKGQLNDVTVALSEVESVHDRIYREAPRSESEINASNSNIPITSLKESVDSLFNCFQKMHLDELAEMQKSHTCEVRELFEQTAADLFAAQKAHEKF